MRPRDHYLHFSRKERYGIITILVIITAIGYLPMLIPSEKAEIITTDISDKIKILKQRSDSVAEKFHRNYSRYDYEENKEISSGELFYFDPNTIDEAGWKRLGLKEKNIATIRNYLSKGGYFREPADIHKVWGINPVLAEDLEAFIRIEKKVYDKPDYRPYERKERTYAVIDINTADSMAFASLPGIGEKLSKRIITYREKLGGFYSVSQVAETYGLKDSVFQKILPYLSVNGSHNKIDINSATTEQLKNHPYIKYHLANAIYQYRQQHGSFKEVGDLRHIMIMNDSIMWRVGPYLVAE